MPENQVSPEPRVEAANHWLGFSLAGQDVRHLEEGFTLRNGVDGTGGFGSFQDGEEERLIDTIHHYFGVRFTASRDRNVQASHAPVTSILLPVVEAVPQLRNVVGLGVHLLLQVLLLPGDCDQGGLHALHLLSQIVDFVQHLLLPVVRGAEGGFFGAFAFWSHWGGLAERADMDGRN